MTFADKLMELRRSRGWSQEQLGERLGVTRQTVSKWELGETTPEMEKLSAMSDIFGITLDELVKGETADSFKEKQSAPENAVAAPKSQRFHYEYKSERSWHGLPLVHINVGFGGCKAKGVLAIGNKACGIFAIGFMACGVVSLGLLSAGIIAMGMLSAGIFASGMLALGVFAAGGAAAGLIAAGGASAGWLSCGGATAGQYAVGGCAFGNGIAFGGIAKGTIAIGDATNGIVTINEPMSAAEFKAIVEQNLPNTPAFITDFFSTLVENLNENI